MFFQKGYMGRGYEFLIKLLRWQNGMAVAGALLILLVLVLLLPTIKTVRSVDVGAEYAGIVLEEGMVVEQSFPLPPGELDYFILWVDQEINSVPLAASEYEDLTLEIKTAQGDVVRRAVRPSFTKRADHTALLFTFTTLVAETTERYTFVLTQHGTGTVGLKKPQKNHVYEDEVIVAAWQLGQKQNWFTSLMNMVFEEDFEGHDISSYLHRGKQIVRGENPYSCVLDELETCIGYPAHLPGMYLITAGFVALGVDTVDDWELVWRPIAITAWFSVGVLLLLTLIRLGQPGLAVATFGFWLFNRWSIEVLVIAHTDFVGVLLLLLAVLLAPHRQKTAALLFGASLAIKQVAILVAPIFLLIVWRYKKPRLLSLVILTGFLVLVPVFTVLPFLIDDYQATIYGLLDIVNRQAQSVHGFAPSLAERLDVTNISKSLLMLVLVGAVYVAAWRRSVDLIGGTLMVFAIMMAFTHVLYHQYFVWFLPFIPLAVAQLRQRTGEVQS